MQRRAGPEKLAAARAKAAPAEREWRSYLNDGQHSPLIQIDRSNVHELRVAWEYAAGGAVRGAASQNLPAPPNLIALQRDGKRIDAVAQATKSGHVFVFERETGARLFPIREAAAEASALAGERLAASQPLPDKPPPFARQGVHEAELTARTPEAHALALAKLRTLSSGEPFAAPSEAGIAVMPGFDGGAEWGGLAWDPETSLLYVNSQEVPACATASMRFPSRGVA